MTAPADNTLRVCDICERHLARRRLGFDSRIADLCLSCAGEVLRDTDLLTALVESVWDGEEEDHTA